MSKNEDCVVIGNALTEFLLDECYDAREISISLIGDVVSEIGATVMEKSTKQEKEEIKAIK